MRPMRRDAHEANRRSWNAATRAHNSHKGDQAAFLRSGGSTLFPEELELLGSLDGKTLVHLQCNAGQDSLSLARLGARVTGVDISDEAIGFAQRLSVESGIAAEFARADVYDFLATTEARFEIAFASYGAVCWLSDLQTWARGIQRVLVEGGRFVLVDFHPAALLYDNKWQPAYPYSTAGEPLVMESGVGDYVGEAGAALAPSGFVAGETFSNPHASHEFAWGIGEIVSALAAAGLRIETLREWDYANGARLYEEMEELPGRRFRAPPGKPRVPLMFGLVACNTKN